MKYHILHHFRTSTPFEEKHSNHFKDLYKMELLTNFDVKSDVISRSYELRF